MAAHNIDLSDGKFTISVSDLMKLIGVVAAIGVSYAMASSRLSMIERGIADGTSAVARLDRRVDTLEGLQRAYERTTNDSFHDYDLRLQSLEESEFGRANVPVSSRRAARAADVPPTSTTSYDSTVRALPVPKRVDGGTTVPPVNKDPPVTVPKP